MRSDDLVRALEADVLELLFCTNSAKPAIRRYEFMFPLVAPTKVPDDRTAQTHHREEMEILESKTSDDGEFWERTNASSPPETESECA